MAQTISLLGHIYISCGLKGEVKLDVEVDDGSVVLSEHGAMIFEDVFQKIVSVINGRINKSTTSYTFTGLTVNTEVVGQIARTEEHKLLAANGKLH